MLFQKWLLVLLIFFGVPLAVVWLSTPFMDINRGTYLAAQKEYRQALTHFNRAIAINSSYASAYGKRGWVHDKLKEPEKALTDYNRAILLDPHDWSNYNNRACLFIQLEQLDKALSDAQQAIALCQNCPFPYDTRGTAYAQLHQCDKALLDFNKALQLQANYLPALYHRSQCLTVSGQHNEAANDIKTAHELERNIN